MAIWIQSLSWTLIYALGQGFVVYASLWAVLKLVPATSANVKHHLSLSALTVLLAWFAATWWQQFHSLMLVNEQSFATQAQHTIIIQQPLEAIGTIEHDGIYRSILSSVNVIFPWLSTCYFLGLMLMLLRLSGGIVQLFSLRKTGISQPDTTLDALLISLKNRLHVEGRVQLFISVKAQVPMVIGCLKPIILMPAAAIAHLSPQQLETILLHELAHIKRHDYLVNILQTIAETMLFFNPFVWMISAIIRREREYCCDDLVLDHTREPLYYATALAALASHPGNASAFAVAASGQSNHLFNRIKRIMEMKKNPFSYSRMVAAILIVTTITCSVVWLTPSFAESKKSKPDEAATILSKQAQEAAFKAAEDEENRLINQLSDDHVIDANQGFTIEKKQNMLYINGQQQTSEIAERYLPLIKQAQMSVEVYPFREWLKQNPQAVRAPFLFPATDRKKFRPGRSGDGC